MTVDEAFSLFKKVIVFCVESFDQILVYVDGAKYYIAAVCIYIIARFLLFPLFRVERGSDTYRKKGG